MDRYQIHEAALKSEYESALKLIGLKVDLNELDTYGHTAIHWAVLTGDTDMARILLEAGANPNILSSDGVTPKWWARDFGLLEIELLLDVYGGKILTNDDFNRAAFSAFNKLMGQSLPEEDNID